MQAQPEVTRGEQRFGHVSLLPRRPGGMSRRPRLSRAARLAMILLELRRSLRALSSATRLLDVPQAGTLASEDARLLIAHELTEMSRYIDQLIEASRTRPQAPALALPNHLGR